MARNYLAALAKAQHDDRLRTLLAEDFRRRGRTSRACWAWAPTGPVTMLRV